MSHQFRSALQAMAGETADRRMHVRLGTCGDYDPALHAARVTIQPEGYETDYIPFRTSWVGAGWGLYSPPSAGDQLVVAFEDGAEYEGAVILGGIFSDAQTPLSVQSGEFWLVHKGGSFLKFTNDGKVLLNTQADLVATVGGDLDVTVAGATNLTSTGDVTVTAPTLRVEGALWVSGETYLSDVLTTGANAQFADVVTIGTLLEVPSIETGVMTIGGSFGEGDLTVDKLTVTKQTDLTGPVSIGGSLHATGAVTGGSTAAFDGVVSSLADVRVNTVSLQVHTHAASGHPPTDPPFTGSPNA